jgi:hypothetical protein
MSVVGCSAAGGDDTGGLPEFSPTPSAAAAAAVDGSGASSASEAPSPSDAEQIVEAYRQYNAAVSEALGQGAGRLPALAEVAAGQALKDARARVRANRDDGVVTTGALEPSVTVAEVDWSGGDEATVTDCVLNSLTHVAADDPDIVEAEATGTRRPVKAKLLRTSDGWVVRRVEMPQDEDSDNPQKDPPFLRGPMPDGPPSCAPPELEQELLARYQAFWDAFDRAFGFGRDGPADPDDPALAETSVDPQLSDTHTFFEELEEKNQTSQGDRDSRDPWVLGVTDFDKTAFIADCVTLGASQTVDLDGGEVVERNKAGRLDYYEARLVHNEHWQVAKLDIVAKELRQCVSPE